MVGAEAIRVALTDYRDAIRHVVSKTVEGMNAGLDPVTIAADLQLPEHLASKPYLQEFYGDVGYASRAYFAGTLGWFDGNPSSLGELPPAAEAAKIITLAGGADAVLSAAETALADGEAQWAMELADRLIFADQHKDAASKVKIQALRQVADSTVNAPTRNYYLLSARELEETLT